MLYPFVGCALVAYSGIVGGLFVFQRRLLYRPGQSRPVLSDDLARLGVREIETVTEDGLTLRSWYLPPRPGGPVIAYFHGNGGHIGYRAERLRRFARAGYGVLLAEYRGYSGNPGTPCERGLYADAAAALDFLEHAGIAPHRLALWGESLGSGVAVQAASRRHVGAVILEAPATSIAEVAQHHFPFVPAARLVQDRFDALSRIGGVRVPIMILHGERDRVVPIRFGRALFEAAPEPKEGWFVAGAGHEDLGHFGGLDAAVAFLDRRLGQSG